MPAAADLWPVLHLYALESPAVRQIEPIGGGWSGSRLWRVTDTLGGQLCLRRWPQEHPTPERLRFIHRVLIQVARSLPIVAAPLVAQGGGTFARHDGHLWELTRWQPGAADESVPTAVARLRAAFTALARFHDLAAECESRHAWPPALEERSRLCQRFRSAGIASIEHALRAPLDHQLDVRAGRLLELCKTALERTPLQGALAVPSELPLLPAIRDVHREHVLFTADEVTGLIDFGALRIDTPLADVARLVGSLAGDDGAARQVALDAYSEVRLLTPLDRQVIELLDRSGLVVGGLNWLTWLYVERRDMGASGPIARRLDEIAGRLARRP